MFYPTFEGGDKICESTQPITWTADEAVKLRFGEKGSEAMPAMTVMSMVKSTVNRYPNQNALGML